MAWDWLQLLPPHERRPLRWRRQILRLRSQLLRPRMAIAALVLVYLMVVVVLGQRTGWILAGLAALPLLLAPLLSTLIYWLLWSEFHR